MTYQLAINSAASPRALIVPTPNGAPAGAIFRNDDGCTVIVKCPCGCGGEYQLPLGADGWDLSGGDDAPTLVPEVSINQLDGTGAIVGVHWAGTLTAGQWAPG